MKKLLVVESPTKARTIGKYLGPGYKVVATVGHIRDLPKSKMGVDLKSDFEVEYVIDPEKKKIVEELLGAAKEAKEIYLATDPDREGEAIAFHAKFLISNLKFLKNKKPSILRIAFHEITKEAVEEALKSAREVDMDLVDAQQGRRVLDRVVGYSLSPVLWKKVRRGLSAGRVQSVAVRLICEREKEIEKFKKEKYYRVLATLGKKEKFGAELIKIGEKSVYKTEKLKLFDGDYSLTTSVFKEEEEVKKFIGKLDKEMVVEKVVGREVHRVPPPAFTTSKLQQAAARRFGWSGKLTMNVAQKLYERGLITYHRTDSVYLSDKATAEFRKYIGEKYGNDYVVSKVRFYKNNSKNAQEAHEAIRPTAAQREELEATDVRERKLYEMIWKRAVATQAAAARIKNTTVNLTDKEALFKASGVNMLFDGYLKLTGEKFEEQTLPELKEGDKVGANKITDEMVETNPPPRYTDASLVGSLEKQGIGRPSTYAPIISTIQNRQYVEKDEGKFKPTSLGVAANEFLVKNFEDVLSLPFTAEMEEELDQVALGKLKWKKMMANFWKGFEKEVKAAEKNGERVKVETEKLGEKCPECKEGELVIRVGRFGKFISCDRFPECKYTRQFKEMAGFKCPKCGAEGVVRRTKTGRKFFGCSAYPTCKWAGWKRP
ncbi:MAG: type I DNA topoisomerase [Candidatus Shapirobacteria bacterium]